MASPVYALFARVRPLASTAGGGLTGTTARHRNSSRGRRPKFAHCRSNNSDVFKKRRPALEGASTLKRAGRVHTHPTEGAGRCCSSFLVAVKYGIAVAVENVNRKRNEPLPRTRDAHAIRRVVAARVKVRKSRKLFPTFSKSFSSRWMLALRSKV